MKKLSREFCLSSFDFLAYLSGTALGQEKAEIEQHLSACEICFDTFISAFNQHLDQTIVPTASRQSPSYACRLA